MPRHLVTIPQAVDANPWLTERWIRRLIAERRIAYHKAGGRVLLDQDDIDQFSEGGRVEATR
jgi:excisionase family DNA binding protein